MLEGKPCHQATFFHTKCLSGRRITTRGVDGRRENICQLRRHQRVGRSEFIPRMISIIFKTI